MKLGPYIKRIRVSRKIKQSELARAINKTPQYICDIEKGRRGQRIDPVMLIAIGNYLNIPLDVLFKISNVGLNDASIAYQKRMLRGVDVDRLHAVNDQLFVLRSLASELISAYKGRDSVSNDVLIQIAETIEKTVNQLDILLLTGSEDEIS